MLSGSAIVDAVGGGKKPGPVISLSASNAIGDIWDFSGTVTDHGEPVDGLTVEFGGVLESSHLTATVEENGSYSLTDEIVNIARGAATAQTQAEDGTPSNIAVAYIINNPCSGATSSIVPATVSGGQTSENPYTLSAVAGLSRYSGDGGAATDASLEQPGGVAVDSSGNLFIADTYNNAIREVDSSTGAITTVAGDGVSGYYGDGGPATRAELDGPTGVAVDAAGDLFVADCANNVIREVNHATGAITTVAGNGTEGYSGDGFAAVDAQLDSPNSVAVSSAGDLFISDSGNNVVREVIRSTGVITAYAGSGACGYSGDGYAAASAQLSDPTGVAVDAAGDILIADSGNNVIREVNRATGVITTIAGTGVSGYSGDGYSATQAELSDPTAIAMGAAGQVFIADTCNDAVREVDLSTGLIQTVAGNGAWGYSGDGGAAKLAELSNPLGVAADAAGDVFIADSLNNVVREVFSSTGLIGTVAGNGAESYSGDGKAATSAELYDPMGVATDGAGNFFIADSNNNVIREVNFSTGVISTVAGNGTWGYSGNGGAATSAQLNDPTGVALDAAGDLFIADSGNNVVRMVDLSTGVITTVAGNGTWGYSGNGGAATGAQLNDPTGVAVDAAGNLFIADACNNVIRKVTSFTGVISTVAGNYGLGSGYTGDGYAATSAQLSFPSTVAVDSVGDIFVADSGNNVVREVDHSTGLINTVAGTDTAGDSGDNEAATAAQFNCPCGIGVDAAGNLYIADTCNNTVREVARPLYWDPAGTGTEDAGGPGTWTTDPSDAYWYDPFLGANVAWCDRSNAIISGGAGTVILSDTVGPTSLALDANDYLDLNGNSILTGALSGRGGTITNNNSLSTSTLTVSQDINTSYYGNIQDGNGAISLVRGGSGALVVGGNNHYSGGTSISSGLFIVANSNALPAGTSLIVGADAVGILSGDGVLIFPKPGQGTDSGDRGGLETNSPTEPAAPTEPASPPEPSLPTGSAPPADAAPVVTAIQCVGQTLRDADSVAFTVTFSEPVTGVSPSDFAVDGLAGIVASVGMVSYSQYTVTVSNIADSSGNLGLALVGAGAICGFYGTPLTATTTFAIDQQYTINRQLYWNTSSGNGAVGGARTWETGWNWRVGSPTGPLQGWCDGSDVVLAGQAGTIVIANPVVVGSITVLANGYIIEGSKIISDSGQTTIDVAAGSVTVGCDLTGGPLVKSGAGKLVLSGVHTYPNSVTVSAGMLQLRSGASLPAGTALLVNGGVLDLGGATATGLTTVTLAGGSIIDGTLNVSTTVDLYSGVVLADLTGLATLDKLGPGTAVLAGENSYQGGTNALDGTLVAYQSSLPSAAMGAGTVIVQPTLYWSGSGDWTSGQWQLADGTPTPWIDGSSVVLAAGSDISLSGLVNVSGIDMAGDATITGGTLSILSGSISVACGTAAIDAELSGSGGLVKTGAGTLVLDGTLAYSGTTVVAGGTLELISPSVAPPVVVSGQAVGPGALYSGDGESLESLDPTMFNLLQSLYVVDQSITRADVIQILESAVDDGAVTLNAISALETLTAPGNEACLNITNYVAVLASDVVQGNPANADYQGQPLGDLADQATDQLRATALGDLVDKWFYGTDLPAVPAGMSYDMTAGPLFVGAPSSADMHQGDLGDCYLISALGALADSNPAAIENMFIDNGDGTYTVRFYSGNSAQGYVADYVTVNDSLPGWQSGGLSLANVSLGGGYWIPLVEKAYAQWNETGNEGRDGRNAYASLTGGGMANVDEQVLGYAATSLVPASDPTDEQELIQAIQSGEAVTAAIFLNGNAAPFVQLSLVSSHAYEVASYNADASSPTFGTFQLENPWGRYEPAPLTWGDLCAYCGFLAVADTSGTVPANGGLVADQSASSGVSVSTVNLSHGPLTPGCSSVHVCGATSRNPAIGDNGASAAILFNRKWFICNWPHT